MVTFDQLIELSKRDPAGDGVLTVYLDVDQSNAVNHNRGYEVALNNELRACQRAIHGDAAQDAFQGAQNRIRAYVQDHQVAEKGLLLIASPQDENVDVFQLDTPVVTQVCWNPLPYIRPLAEAINEFPRYAVAQCARDETRIVVCSMRRSDTHVETGANRDVHQFDGTGHDGLLSQMRLQHRQDTHVQQHMKAVADELDRLARETPFRRLVLSGPEESVSALHHVLPDHLKAMVAGRASVEATAGDATLMAETESIIHQWERDRESRLADEVIAAAAKGGRATTGLDETLQASLGGRVQMLVYAPDIAVDEADRDHLRERMEAQGGPAIRLLADNGSPQSDVVDWLMHVVLRHGGTIEQLRGDAADRFRSKARGVGAVLRY